jgi:hypothetical protein
MLKGTAFENYPKRAARESGNEERRRRRTHVVEQLPIQPAEEGLDIRKVGLKAA